MSKSRLGTKRPIKFNTAKRVPGNDHFCAVLAELAYKTQSEIEKELVEHGYNDSKVTFFSSSLTAGFILEVDDVIAVAFRGSSTWREWLNNLNIHLRRTPCGGIHSGFKHTIEQIDL